MIKSIVIVGGGTAGWMCASLMHARWKKLGIQITLIESPDIDAIGVGEGSTPFLKSFFDYLNIDEAEWMPKCNATYKANIEFAAWSTRPGFEAYSHPFPFELDGRVEDVFIYNTAARRKGASVHAHPDRYMLGAMVAQKKACPIPKYSFPFQSSYGYHFDSIKLGQFLRERAMRQGVIRKELEVKDVELNAQGDIQTLKTITGVDIIADFFVDCTGFASVLSSKTLKTPFIDYGSNLFNDAAIAIPTDIDEAIPSQTRSTALKHGWAWKIPLTNRYGNGYVYSSRYCNAEQAETELRAHLNIPDSADVSSRHINVKLGRLENAWCQNCVAVGLSQGFIEPLEATAIDFIQTAIQDFIDAFETGNFTAENRERFNDKLNYQYERVRDYIVMHYMTNSRTDSEYWRDNRNHQSLSDELKRVFHHWMQGDDLEKTIATHKVQAFNSTSWHCLFGGMGIYPPAADLDANSKLIKYDLKRVDDFLSRCALNYPDHTDVLKKQNASAE